MESTKLIAENTREFTEVNFAEIDVTNISDFADVKPIENEAVAVRGLVTTKSDKTDVFAACVTNDAKLIVASVAETESTAMGDDRNFAGMKLNDDEAAAVTAEFHYTWADEVEAEAAEIRLAENQIAADIIELTKSKSIGNYVAVAQRQAETETVRTADQQTRRASRDVCNKIAVDDVDAELERLRKQCELMTLKKHLREMQIEEGAAAVTNVSKIGAVRKVSTGSNAATDEKVRCFNCSTWGHVMIDCPYEERPADACFRCWEKGHAYRDCTKPKKRLPPLARSASATMSTDPDW